MGKKKKADKIPNKNASGEEGRGINKDSSGIAKEEFARLEQFIESSRRAALAPRMFYLAMIFSSAVTFFAYWNALPHGWTKARIVAYRNAIPWVDSNDLPAADVSRETMESYLKAQQLINTAGVHDKKQLISYLENTAASLETVLTEDIRRIRIDVLGVSFDVNDLGLFAGFVLFVMLTAFLFSLYRELENVKITYYDLAWPLDKVRNPPDESILDYHRAYLTISAEEARDCVHRQYCLRRLATSMIVIVPTIRGPVNRFLRHGPKVGLALPFLAQLLILMNDFSTISLGFAYSTSGTLTVSVLSFLWLIGIGIMAYLSVGVMRKIEVFFLTESKRVGLFAPQLNMRESGGPS